MLSSTLSAVAMVAMGAFALPTPQAAPAASSGSTYTVHIQNKCSTTKHFATFQIQQPSFVMNQLSKVTSLEAGKNGTITIPVEAKGVRLSAKGDQGVAAQWAAQPLVEFGYSDFTYAGAAIKSISYDLSMMETGVLGDGLSVCPTACPNQCKSKLANAVADIKQAWTNPNQVADGSPADTLCSAPNGGVTDFEVVWNACS